MSVSHIKQVKMSGQVADVYVSPTFTLGLVLADGPPGFAFLAHVSTMLSATAAGLGFAILTLAHVRCKHKWVMSANTDGDNHTVAMTWVKSNLLHIYNPTPTPSQLCSEQLRVTL